MSNTLTLTAMRAARRTAGANTHRDLRLSLFARSEREYTLIYSPRHRDDAQAEESLLYTSRGVRGEIAVMWVADQPSRDPLARLMDRPGSGSYVGLHRRPVKGSLFTP